VGRLSARPLLIATRSAHKLAEIRQLLADMPIEVLGLVEAGVEELEEERSLEPFHTFGENALSKARYFRRRTRLPTLADDSGLCVDALDGDPGVRTRRFAPDGCVARWGRDEANNRWLLACLDDTPTAERGAHYVCALAAVDERGESVFEGRVDGSIAERPRGTGGFGYDPLFVPQAETLTYAELPPEVKRATSHRSRAVRAARAWIAELPTP